MSEIFGQLDGQKHAIEMSEIFGQSDGYRHAIEMSEIFGQLDGQKHAIEMSEIFGQSDGYRHAIYMSEIFGQLDGQKYTIEMSEIFGQSDGHRHAIEMSEIFRQLDGQKHAKEMSEIFGQSDGYRHAIYMSEIFGQLDGQKHTIEMSEIFGQSDGHRHAIEMSEIFGQLDVKGVSMTIAPSSIVVGLRSANRVTRLELECNSTGTNNIETLYRLEISRKKFSEQEYVEIAAVDAYKIAKNFPPDMKSPNASGGLVPVEAPTSGTLVMTMDGVELTCNDTAEFKCTMTYKMTGTVLTSLASESNNVTVIDCTSGGNRLNEFKSTWAVLGIIVSMYQFMNLLMSPSFIANKKDGNNTRKQTDFSSAQMKKKHSGEAIVTGTRAFSSRIRQRRIEKRQHLEQALKWYNLHSLHACHYRTTVKALYQSQKEHDIALNA
ncbi:hypothetical protein CHS0354_040461 [Potamilus streckersoni]|uniref:Uncharacterized protein n=1 Tax=Potamilus streckersoni TaxID=2493646 RepID=A0AAE0T042_9BIVA|nr:hypothetical protein CHS0354_040461 [Potamilus streckersoni]